MTPLTHFEFVPVALLSGPTRHSALIFMEFADHIRREEGIDVYQRQAQWEADRPMILQLLTKWRKDKTFADESLLDAVWRECMQESGILTKDEQQAKDDFSLVKARTAKQELREFGLADKPRFGYCKRRRCVNSKIERLLIRGFCPGCRGVEMKQVLASFTVSTIPKNIHPDVLEPTTTERRHKVLDAKHKNPEASEREISKLSNVPRSTVQDILRNPSVNRPPGNSFAVIQFLSERAERQDTIKQDAHLYLKNR